MNRYILALSMTAIGLFGFNAWSSYFLDHNPAARDFFASRAFTIALFFGGLMAIFALTICAVALIFGSDAPVGSQEPEDRT